MITNAVLYLTKFCMTFPVSSFVHPVKKSRVGYNVALFKKKKKKKKRKEKKKRKIPNESLRESLKMLKIWNFSLYFIKNVIFIYIVSRCEQILSFNDPKNFTYNYRRDCQQPYSTWASCEYTVLHKPEVIYIKFHTVISNTELLPGHSNVNNSIKNRNHGIQPHDMYTVSIIFHNL